MSDRRLEGVSRRGVIRGAGAALIASLPANTAPILQIGLFVDLGDLSVPAGSTLIRTLGHTQPGLGAAEYREAPAGPATAWRKQTRNGRWFEFAEREVRVSQVGGIGYDHAHAVRPDRLAAPHSGPQPAFEPTAETVSAPIEDVALSAWAACATELGIAARLDEGRAFRQSAAVRFGARAVVNGQQASLTTTARHINQLELGDSARVSGLRIVGPGGSYSSQSNGILVSGIENGPGVAPEYITGPTLDAVTVRGIGERSIYLRYVLGGTITDCSVVGFGYAGVAIDSSNDVWVRRNHIRHGFGHLESQDCYGAYWSRWAASDDDVRYPQARGGGAEFNVIESIPTWHGLDTHAGVGHAFRFNTFRNCRRAAVITHDPYASARDHIVEGNRAINTFEVDDVNRQYSPPIEKRAEAYWIVGRSAADPALNIIHRNNYAEGHGRTDKSTGAYYFKNVEQLVAEGNEDRNSYMVGLCLDGHVRGRITRHRTYNARSPGTRAGASSDFPFGVLIQGDGYDLDLEDNQVIRDDRTVDAHVVAQSVRIQPGSNRSLRFRGANQRYDGVVPGIVNTGSRSDVTGAPR